MHINVELKNRLFQNLYFWGFIKSWKDATAQKKNLPVFTIQFKIMMFIKSVLNLLTEIIQSLCQFKD